MSKLVVELKKDKKKSKRCPDCGFKINGKNHEMGEHHNRGKHGKMKPSKSF
jgi:ribosomal protein L34E